MMWGWRSGVKRVLWINVGGDEELKGQADNGHAGHVEKELK
jgi:hypothetical protein